MRPPLALMFLLPLLIEPIHDNGFEPFSCAAGDDPRPNDGAVEEPGSGGCPAGMQAVANFCIDRFEAALLDVSVPAAAVAWSPYRNPGNTPVRAISASFAVPQGYISGEQALAACQASGKRLCTDQEWLRACRGPAGLTFPYGNSRIPGSATTPARSILCSSTSAPRGHGARASCSIRASIGYRTASIAPGSMRDAQAPRACST